MVKKYLMNNEDILKENDGKKFDICLMNPPYAYKEDNCLDINFVNKCLNIANKQVVIMPNILYKKNGPYTQFFNKNVLKEIELIKSKEAFDIFTHWEYVGIYTINSLDNYEQINIINPDNSKEIINNKLFDRQDYNKKLNWGNLYYFIQRTQKLYDDLKEKYKSMCHDCDNFIYEENKGGLNGIKKPQQKKLERVKKYLKEGTYKYCIYKGSGNHSYDKPQEWLGQDPDKVFNGQACWLTNKENVKNNIKYWMETPLFDAWRLYYFNHAKLAVCWIYCNIPALDFDKPEDEFKKYVDSLYKYTDEDIKILKEYNIHNADKL